MHAYTKECALFLPGDGALSVFRADRRLAVQWWGPVAGPVQMGSRGCKDSHISFTRADATHFYCPLSVFKTPVYQLACRTYVSGRHMSLPTHTHHWLQWREKRTSKVIGASEAFCLNLQLQTHPVKDAHSLNIFCFCDMFDFLDSVDNAPAMLDFAYRPVSGS